VEYAEIVLNRPMRQSYHYRVPERLRPALCPGKRVLISFGKKNDAEGYCVGLVDKVNFPPEKIKDIIGVLDKEPLLTPVMLALTRQVAEHYCCSWGEVIQATVPSGVRRTVSEKTIKVVKLLMPLENVKAFVFEHRGKKKDKQARVLRVLAEEIQGDITPFELSSICAVSRGVINKLRSDGHVEYEERVVEKDLFEAPAEKESHLELNEEQQAALDHTLRAVHSGSFSVTLLQGVTGSGKTEVYLQAIEEVISSGKQAIVMVPEISLTPQMVQRFRARFDGVAVLHSRQTEAQRREQWNGIRDGKATVVIGPRSAVFAPVPALGLLVIDEEHENSFKQDSSPRYNGRDVAIMRGKLENAVVLLGSATPSLESFINCRTGKFDRVLLTKRVAERPMPPVHIVDMNLELEGAKYWNFLSRPLTVRMKETLERDEQVLLFLNRRGFSTQVRCPRCRHQLGCNQCDTLMTYYQVRHLAVCLHCRQEMVPPELCPSCGVGRMRYLGIGTEKIEEEVKRQFPEFPVARMDSDTMRGHDAYEKQFAKFREGKTRILVGTQMISKGLDMPNVTLVGVISADTSLNLGDFRAFERTFQLVAQVAGRAGRGTKPGQVVVQTFSPEHHAITMAAEHDFERFAAKESEDRKALLSPPFSRSMRIIFSGLHEKEVEDFSEKVGENLRKIAPDAVTFLGPAPCLLSKVRNMYRFHMMGFAPKVGMIRYLASSLDPVLGRKRKVEVALDVDPVNMF